MKVYHEFKGTMRYIVVEESEHKDKVLGLTTNQMLIVVNSDNKRIDEYQCPKAIWRLYLEEIHEALITPDYQVCLYFGEQHSSDEDL